MIDILAGFSLAAAAAHTESPVQLISDAEVIYGLYAKNKLGKLDIHELANSGDLKTTIEAAARLLAVANKLADDPAQLKNIAELLTSI